MHINWMLIKFSFSTCFAKKIFSMRLSWTIVPSGSDSGCHLNKNIRPYTGLKLKINEFKSKVIVFKNLFNHAYTTKIKYYWQNNCWKNSYLRFSKLVESKLHNSSTWSPSQPAFERIKMSYNCNQCKINI